MMTKSPKNDFKIESTSSSSRLISKFHEKKSRRFKNQEKFDFKIQEKMNSSFKRRNQEDFTMEVLKRFFKKQT